MREVLASVATGEVTVASRAAQLDGIEIDEGRLPRARGRCRGRRGGRRRRQPRSRSSSVCSQATVRGSRSSPGEDAPPLEGLLETVARSHPDARGRGARGRAAALPTARRRGVSGRRGPVRLLLVEDNDVVPRRPRVRARAPRRRRGGREHRRRIFRGCGVRRASSRRRRRRLPPAGSRRPRGRRRAPGARARRLGRPPERVRRPRGAGSGENCRRRARPQGRGRRGAGRSGARSGEQGEWRCS